VSGGNSSSLTAGPAREKMRRPADTTVQIGPLTVRTAAADVDAFTRALGSRGTYGPVPWTFPIRWLSLPEVRSKISRVLSLDQSVVVQQSQTFHYASPLERDRDYSFEIVGYSAAASHDRTMLCTKICGTTGNDVVLMETVLRTLRQVPAVARPSQPMRDTSAPADEMMLLRVEPFDFAQLQCYTAASLDNNPLHSDIDTARTVGLNDLIVHGMLVMGQFEPALIKWRRDLRITRLYGTFLQPLPVGVKISVSGRVVKASTETGGEENILRLVARTDKGQVVCVGEVTGHSAANCASCPGLP
jgi:acyl dehydratase